jgi:RNase P subunit RPR2
VSKAGVKIVETMRAYLCVLCVEIAVNAKSAEIRREPQRKQIYVVDQNTFVS